MLERMVAGHEQNLNVNDRNESYRIYLHKRFTVNGSDTLDGEPALGLQYLIPHAVQRVPTSRRVVEIQARSWLQSD